MSRLSQQLGVGAVALLLALGIATPPTRGQSETIKIVSSLPRTGALTGRSDSIVNAMRMALDEAGHQAGGMTIVYEERDNRLPIHEGLDAGADGLHSAAESLNASLAARDPDVMVYLTTSSVMFARLTLPPPNAANLVMISPGMTHPGLTRPAQGVWPNEPYIYRPVGVPNFARVIPADDLQGVAGAVWARDLGAGRVYILAENERAAGWPDFHGHGTAIIFRQAAERIGLPIVGGPDGVDPAAADYRDLAARVAAAGPDLVYLAGVARTNDGRLVRELRAALGPEVKLMGPSWLYDRRFPDDGWMAEGAYIASVKAPAGALAGRGAAWVEAYRQAHGAEPDADAAYGYEAMKLALDAIGRAGRKDRAAIRDAVFATRDFEGLLGRWSIDANGDTTLAALSGRRIAGGRPDEETAVLLGDGGLSVPSKPGAGPAPRRWGRSRRSATRRSRTR